VSQSNNRLNVTGCTHYYTVSKNDTDVAHYNSDADRPILIIFGM